MRIALEQNVAVITNKTFDMLIEIFIQKALVHTIDRGNLNSSNSGDAPYNFPFFQQCRLMNSVICVIND